jgi:hypothetical protein
LLRPTLHPRGGGGGGARPESVAANRAPWRGRVDAYPLHLQVAKSARNAGTVDRGAGEKMGSNMPWNLRIVKYCSFMSSQLQSNRPDFAKSFTAKSLPGEQFESSTEDESSASDVSEEEPKTSSMRRTTHSERTAKLTPLELMTLESRLGTSFVKKIGRNLAQMAINSSYDRLKSVNFLIPGPPGSSSGFGGGQAKTRPGTKGDPSTDPRLRTVNALAHSCSSQTVNIF